MSGLLARGLAAARCVGTSALRSNGLAPAVVPVQIKAREMSGPASPFSEAYFKMRGYNQYGLLHDDILSPLPIVEQAVTRLPDEMQDLRNFRLTRAMQCSVQKSVLPKEEWTTYEEDQKNGKYLQPYIDEIEREEKERAEWGTQM